MSLWYPPILAYHRVDPQPASDTPTVSIKAFERQMEILAARWRPIPLGDLADCLEAGRVIPRRAVAVTFDDGEEGLFTHAFPILERCRIPALIFLIADNVGKAGSLSPGQIARMREGGIQFGSHTVHHAYLPSLPMEQVRRELAESKRLLESRGIPAEFFSYPGGGFTPEIAEAAREAGYRAACTTNRGIRRFPADRWALRRVAMHANTVSPLGVWIRCCGYYGLNRRLREPA
ncbi:MAG: polysaccharide deacetylase family protein [Candidatus Omnitrophica bacterium]|nr:polysaccharide deacetylase family protein [Candidatus Omnitrophota bacterium]